MCDLLKFYDQTNYTQPGFFEIPLLHGIEDGVVNVSVGLEVFSKWIWEGGTN